MYVELLIALNSNRSRRVPAVGASGEACRECVFKCVGWDVRNFLQAGIRFLH